MALSLKDTLKSLFPEKCIRNILLDVGKEITERQEAFLKLAKTALAVLNF